MPPTPDQRHRATRTSTRLALCVALALALPGARAIAPAPKGIAFTHGDWELACDNTRTCRAAGYHDDADAAVPVSVLLTRKAGPGTPVKAELQLGGSNDERVIPKNAASLALTMRIDGKPVCRVLLTRANWIPELGSEQTRALLAALARTGTIDWTDGRRTWKLSGDGAAAVLLKMDDFQGRVGTPGALVRKGTKDEASVLPPLPAPVVVAAPVPPAAKIGEALLPPPALKGLRAALVASLEEGECDQLTAPQSEPDGITLARLAPDLLLASTTCWRGAYNEGIGYWVIRRAAPFAPQLVTTGASSYDNGTIEAGQRGRGVGDCWSNQAWVWNGERFVQTEDATTGMCKEIAAGGAWSLPTLVTAVKRGPRAR